MDILTFVGRTPVGQLPPALKKYLFTKGAKKTAARKAGATKAVVKKIPLKGKGKK
jgi:hypothetical protein